MTRLVFDVAVVGAGAVGLTAAALFARAGARACVIAASFDPAPPCGNYALRTYAVTPGSARILAAVGAWELLDRERAGVFESMSVWDAGSGGALEFAAPNAACVPLGWIVEQQNLIAALYRSLESSRVEFLSARVSALEIDSNARLRLDDGRELNARLVVGADGAHSFVREAAGCDWKRSPYEQQALICNITTQLEHGRRARQRFLPSGPLALLPLAEPHATSVVWSCTAELAMTLETLDDSAFAERLEHASEHCLGAVRAVSKRASFDLARARAEPLVHRRVALVGDAAHSVHPLAGQGLNLGIADAAALVECLDPVGAYLWPRPAALNRYARWRKSAALDLTLITDGLQRLFAREKPPVTWLRGAGLEATDRCPRLKAWLCARAMGLVGDVPALASTASGRARLLT